MHTQKTEAGTSHTHFFFKEEPRMKYPRIMEKEISTPPSSSPRIGQHLVSFKCRCECLFDVCAVLSLDDDPNFNPNSIGANEVIAKHIHLEQYRATFDSNPNGIHVTYPKNTPRFKNNWLSITLNEVEWIFDATFPSWFEARRYLWKLGQRHLDIHVMYNTLFEMHVYDQGKEENGRIYPIGHENTNHTRNFVFLMELEQYHPKTIHELQVLLGTPDPIGYIRKRIDFNQVNDFQSITPPPPPQQRARSPSPSAMPYECYRNFPIY